jgi:hypothetical protein
MLPTIHILIFFLVNLSFVVCHLLTFHILIFSLKPISQMNWNLVGSIYGRSSLKSAHFVIIHYQTWPPQAILVSDWQIFFNLLLLIVEYLVSNHGNSLHVDASYQILVHLARQFQRRRFFRYRPIRNKNCLWWPLVGSIYGRSSLKSAHFVIIHYKTWPPQAILVSDWPI